MSLVPFLHMGWDLKGICRAANGVPFLLEPAVAQQVVERVLPAGLVLVRSPLLQVREVGVLLELGTSLCMLVRAQK
jgi:hypothetical protein